MHDCATRGAPVACYLDVEVKFLDTGDDGKRRDLVPCTLRVTPLTLEMRFARGRSRTHNLKYVRKWGHRGTKLSIILGDSADHLRLATRSERDAVEITHFLAHITKRGSVRKQ